MLVDLVLVAAIAVIQLVITLYAVIVSIRKRRLRIAFIVGGLGLLGIVLTVLAAYRASKSQEEMLGMITGGDSFTFASFYGFDDDQAQLLIRQSGSYPVHGVTAFLSDFDRYNGWYRQHIPLKAGDKFPGEHVYSLGDFPVHGVQSELGRFDLDESGEERFVISFVAMNGYWVEYLQLTRVGGKWLQAFRVSWQGRNIPRCVRHGVYIAPCVQLCRSGLPSNQR